MARSVLLLSGAVSIVLSLAAGSADAAASYRSVKIEGVPFIRQKPDFCGEACAAMYLKKLGRDYDQDAVFDQAGLKPELGRGCYTAELNRALKNIGFQPGSVWETVSAARAKTDMEIKWKALHADLLAGVPSIICTRFDEQPGTTEHFRLILGYDSKRDEVIYHEPAEDNGAYLRMSRKKMLDLWPLKYNTKKWTVVRLLLKPGNIKHPPSAGGFTDADFAQHIMKLKKKIPGREFTVIIERPFVVIGDETPAMVRRRSTGTVRWSVDRLKKGSSGRSARRV